MYLTLFLSSMLEIAALSTLRPLSFLLETTRIWKASGTAAESRRAD